MEERNNERWLQDLAESGEAQEAALADLRQIIQRGLPYALSQWLSPADPAFDALAEDTTQETLLRVLDKLHTFQGRSKFTTWVHKIAVRVALTELRRKRWQNISLDGMAEASSDMEALDIFEEDSPSPESITEQHELMARIGTIIEEALTENQRKALVAVGIQGVPTAEVARQMGTNRNALYKLIHDGRLALKKALAEEGLTPEDIMAVFEA